MSRNNNNDRDSFRDSLATVDDRGGRIWVYPKKPTGKFYNIRTYLSWVLLIVLFGLPFINVNGNPLFLFNVIERNFILFGVIFTPQDLDLFALAMITFMVFIVLFTVVFGRVFCGWVCPQTIFLEMVFRKIEYWIEGDANQQRKLNKAPWSQKKFLKKLFKHVIFFTISVLIANIFLSYIIGVNQVKQIISEPIGQHTSGFIAMIIFSGMFYYVFAFFREQVCIAVCPYGRLQGVLLVKNSIVVIYDWMRGEPRGKMRKKKVDTFVELPLAEPENKLGDCIDCHLCVQVCPTGIDIRNGTQLECVNCTACMDACDEVMRKIDRPEGLIRLDSESNVESKQQKILTPRVYAYSAILLALLVLQSFLFMNRSDTEVSLLRTPGILFQETDDGYISNLYNYQIVNKTNRALTDIDFKLLSEGGRVKLVGKPQNVDKLKISKGSLFIEMEKDRLKSRKNKVKIEVFIDGKSIDILKTNFLGPIK